MSKGLFLNFLLKQKFEYPISKLTNQLTPLLMEPEGSMPHSQGLSNNPYPEPN